MKQVRIYISAQYLIVPVRDDVSSHTEDGGF